MVYDSIEELVAANPAPFWRSGRDGPLSFRPVLEMLADPVDGAPFYRVHHAKAEHNGKKFMMTRVFINTTEGWRSIGAQGWRALSDCMRNMYDSARIDPDIESDLLLANSVFTLSRPDKSIFASYQCTRVDVDPKDKFVMPPIAYILISTLNDGRAVTREFPESYIKKHDGLIPGLMDLHPDFSRRAEVVVRINVQTGRSEVLKNRWGPTSHAQIGDMAKWKALPESNFRFVALPPSPPSKNVIFEHLMPKGPDFVEMKGVKPASTAQICKCSMMDLLSGGGHNSDCPEKKL